MSHFYHYIITQDHIATILTCANTTVATNKQFSMIILHIYGSTGIGGLQLKFSFAEPLTFDCQNLPEIIVYRIEKFLHGWD
jgi:hypothetical protein